MTDPQPSPGPRVEIACGACGTRFHEALTRLKTTNVVHCPGCAKPIKVRRYMAQAAASRMFEKLTGIAGGTKGT